MSSDHLENGGRSTPGPAERILVLPETQGVPKTIVVGGKFGITGETTCRKLRRPASAAGYMAEREAMAERAEHIVQADRRRSDVIRELA
jgi:hypothetical protein